MRSHAASQTSQKTAQMLQTSNPRQTRAERRAEASSRRGFVKAIAASGGELDTALVDAADTLAGHPKARLLRDGKADFYNSPTACIICLQRRPPAAFFFSWPTARARAATVSGICSSDWRAYDAEAIERACTRVLRRVLPQGSFRSPPPLPLNTS